MANQLTEQATIVWKKAPVSKRITMAGLLLAAIVVVGLLIGWANQPSYSVVYSGLSDSDAGQIIQRMDELGITYKVKGSGTILVESDKVYEVRMTLATEGLPESSTVGYELFSESTLGMTEFTQKVNYQRALEGELERTIASLNSVESVRVHVVTPEKTLLSGDQSPTTASVIIKKKSGGAIDSAQVKAIANLVAFSVEGLAPENVVIVDANRNAMVSLGGEEVENVSSQTDNQRAAEIAAASEIQSKVQNLLDSILGPNRSAVEASVVMDWSQKEVTSNIYDPTQTVLRSEQTITEGYGDPNETTSGVPGAASNLPTPVATPTAETGTSNYYHSEQVANYEISQTQTREVFAPGKIQKVSLAVMVDSVTDEAQLESITSAVMAAAGIDTARGDTVAVNTMEFDRSYFEEQQVALAETEKSDQYMQIGIAAGAGVLLLVLFIYFARVLRNIRMASQAAWKPILMPVSAAAALQNGQASSTPAVVPDAVQNALTEPAKPAEPVDSRIAQDGKGFPEDEQRARMISRLTEESPATIAEIIQIWLAEDEKTRV
jgi:flagellar M-ring protein FliF